MVGAFQPVMSEFYWIKRAGTAGNVPAASSRQLNWHGGRASSLTPLALSRRPLRVVA